MEIHKIRSAGGIVLGDNSTVAMVRRNIHERWFFPKGGTEDGETLEAAARREIGEEAGLFDLELLGELGSYERPRILKDGVYSTSDVKEIHMFLFRAPPHSKVHAAYEIAEATWIPFDEVAASLQDEKDRAWFSSVCEHVRQAIKRD